MGFVARVLVVGGDTELTTGLSQKLSRRGYSSLIANSGREAMPFAVNGHADIVLADPETAGDLSELSAALRREGHKQLPMLLLGGSASADSPSLPVNCTDVELFSRLDSLVRLNTMQEELNRRSATAEKFGVTVPSVVLPPTIADAQVLVLCDQGPVSSALAAALAGIAKVTLVEDTFTAIERLIAGNFDTVIVAAESALARQLCSDIRVNSRLYNTPVLVIAEPVREMAEAIYSSGANEVMQQPWAAADLASRAGALVRQHRYRLQMQRIYREGRHLATSDNLTGLYNHGFLHEHLAQQILAARQGGKSLTVGALDIQRLSRINREQGYAAGDRLLRQVGSLIGNLVRGEDLTARWGGGTFCIVLPDTAPEVAFFALHRIAGVVDHTEFALLDPTQAVSVRLKVGAAGLYAGDGAESLIARAFAAMA